jgi:prolipoprotein diacylglyceryl transferase
VGARIYHVLTDYQLYTDDPLRALAIWDGGLGIWGGIAAGVGAGLFVAKRRGLPLRTMMDVAAPALALAQALGRWGNYFHQELFGRPTSLPWSLRVDPQHRPSGYETSSTFHPTFLYESLWNLLVCGSLLLIEKRFRLGPGRLFGIYVMGYTFGRFFIERLRIDDAHHIGGLRLNDWTALIVFFTTAAILFLTRDKDKKKTPAPGSNDPAIN